MRRLRAASFAFKVLSAKAPGEEHCYPNSGRCLGRRKQQLVSGLVPFLLRPVEVLLRLGISTRSTQGNSEMVESLLRCLHLIPIFYS